ncbi:MAG: DUF3810 domain-containing protein [Vallitalea sp.]|nr:DUF3810 domain-containing protein [Vallitalea sp.]
MESQINTKEEFRKWYGVLLLPIAILLTNFASSSPDFIEKYYSNGIYPIIGQCLSNITGILPISVAEMGVIFIVVFFVYLVINTIIKLIRYEHKSKVLINFVRKIVLFISIGYFIFVIIWGLNYYRLPFSQIANLSTHEATVNKLSNLCESLILQANELRNEVKEDKNGVMQIPKGHIDVLERANKGYEILENIYPELRGKYGRAKPVVFSKAMSYAGITGIYFPFTAEANVNKDRTDVLLPATTCHEMAHQRGFAREDEANYIAYLTCKYHPDTDFRYSGIILALIHSMGKLYEYDIDAYEQLKSSYSEGVIRDLQDNSNYWKRFSGPIDRVSTNINNTYLKLNKQKDGVHSYGRMVDLLIAEYSK